jgi:hypothetical protein
MKFFIFYPVLSGSEEFTVVERSETGERWTMKLTTEPSKN